VIAAGGARIGAARLQSGQRSDMSRSNVMITVDDAHRDKFAAVVKACVAAGLTVEEKMPTLAALTGTIDEANLAALRKVPGVGAVEKSREVRAIRS
jgi:hypothetical protein